MPIQDTDQFNLKHASHRVGRRLLNHTLAPVINPQNFAVNENVPLSTVIGTVVASNPNPGQNLTFSITGDNSLWPFSIDRNNGLLTVSAPINYELQNAYDLMVQVAEDPVPTPLLLNPTNYAMGSYPQQPQPMVIDDINDDGHLDLITANLAKDTVSILLGNGKGGFGSVSSFAVGVTTPGSDYPTSLVIGDMNGDNKLDIAVVTEESVYGTGSILLGDGTGNFGTVTDFGDAMACFSIAIGDVNEDGHLDLLTANYYDESVSVFLGDGSGSFGLVAKLGSGGSGPYSIAMGDFNGDAHLDLVIANSESDNVSLLLGDGVGSFGSTTNFAVGDAPRFITKGDLNADGNLDLVVGNLNSGTVSVLLGDGMGSFGASANFDVNGNPFSIAIGDVNGDGNLDLVSANGLAAGTVSLLLGDGTGSFSTAIAFNSGGTFPYSVALGNLDGAGNLDVVVTNQYSDVVSVLLGNERPRNASAIVHIDILDINDPPVLQTNQFPIIEGQALTISSAQLEATDEDHPDSSLLFSISALESGQFELSSAVGIAQASFTQQQVQNSQVQFVPDGTKNAPAFQVSVSDGALSTTPIAASISFNAYPVLEKNTLTVDRGQTVILTQEHLKATDVTNNDPTLLLTISDLQHGQFMASANPTSPLLPITQFTQQRIINKEIQFVHDDGGTAPAFSVTVSDGELTDGPKAAAITFNSGSNAITVTNKSTRVRDAIIGSVVGGFVGLIFLGMKLYIKRKADQRMKKALAGENEVLEGVEGQRAAFFKNVISPIATELFNHIAIKSFVGISEEKMHRFMNAVSAIVTECDVAGVNIDLPNLSPAEQTEVMDEIARQTKLVLVGDSGYLKSCVQFFKPQTTPEAMEAAAPEIAAHVRVALTTGRGRAMHAYRSDIEMMHLGSDSVSQENTVFTGELLDEATLAAAGVGVGVTAASNTYSATATGDYSMADLMMRFSEFTAQFEQFEQGIKREIAQQREHFNEEFAAQEERLEEMERAAQGSRVIAWNG